MCYIRSPYRPWAIWDESASPNGLETMGVACDDASAWEAVVEKVLVRIKVLKMNMMSVLVH